MKYVKQGTKQAKTILANYEWAKSKQLISIYDAYERPSRYKVSAWRDCVDLCRRYDGDCCYICGYNSMTFSAIFRFTDPETGVLSICWITKDNIRYTDYI